MTTVQIRRFLMLGRQFSLKCSSLLKSKELGVGSFIQLRFKTDVPSDDFVAEKLYNARQSLEAYLTQKAINPRGVFSNNELNLGEIQVYGFDYDYTLAVYKESLHYLIYELGRDLLINKFKYPNGIRELEYKSAFAIRGLHYDMQRGLLMKLDSFHQIELESVYRGMTQITAEEIFEIYGGSYIPQEMIRGSSTESTKMKQLNDLFSVPEVCLLSRVTEYFERNNLAYHPEILSYDIQNAVQNIHPVMHKMLKGSLIDEYVEENPRLSEFLTKIKEAGKKTFLLTNSPFYFVDSGMRFMIGDGWAELFDVIIVQARKPKFFMDHSRPFRKYDIASKSQLWERVTELKKGCVYIEGNLKELQRLTGWYGNMVLYFGDQIYSDLADLTLHHGWRTGAIIRELAREIKIINSEKFRRDVGWLQILQHMIEELQTQGKADEILLTLQDERDGLRRDTKKVFNSQFGSIFRSHHNPTYFSRRLFRYSDIYTSHLTNLLDYSFNHTFYPRRGVLPHEARIPYM